MMEAMKKPVSGRTKDVEAFQMEAAIPLKLRG